PGAAHRAAAFRQRAQRAQRAGPRAPAPGQPPVRRPRAPAHRRGSLHPRCRRHPGQPGVWRGGPGIMTLEALIFDVDGTLADTEAAHMAAFNEAFSQEGLDWRWDRPLYTR